MCFCVCKESNILVQRSTDPKLSLRAGQDRGARHWKMLIVQDGSAHSARALSSTPTATGRAHLAHPRHGSPAPRLTRTSRTRATAHPLSSCLLAIVCSTCGALSGPSTRWFVGDHCCTPTKALSASIFKLRKSRRFRRHHLWHRGRAGPTRGSLRFPSWKRRAQRQLSVKAACAAKSSFSQAGPRAVTSPCVSQSSQP